MRITTFFTWLFSITMLAIFCISTIPIYSQCLNDQRTLLLELKNNIKFYSSFSTKLVKWNQSTDCCYWHGVACNKGGRVIGLDLSYESIFGGMDRSSSLFSLQFLESLNLASNNFNSTQIPSSFGNLTSLKYLNLSDAGFAGQIPIGLSHLTRLVTLDLSTLHIFETPLLQLENPNLSTLLQNLTGLTELHLDSVNISALSIEWCQAILSSLPNLRVLSMSNCYLSGPICFSLNISGSIPSVQMFKNLTYLDLSFNALTGSFPSSYFEGHSNLINIDLSYNSFNGSTPTSLFSLPSLRKIQLSNNHFGGHVARFPNESLSPLDTLDLSNNKLQGPIPTNFFNFRRLTELSLSFNNFSGTIQLEWIQRLQNLSILDLSHNSLSINASDTNSSLFSFPQFSMLGLASCKLQKFPPLMNQSGLNHLDLSNNQISGEIPNWIWNVGNGTLWYLNLSCNLLVGMQRQYTIPSLVVLDLHSNQLHGKIPIPPESARYLDYSNNNFNSSFPVEIGNNLSFRMFFLSNNCLTGTIPQSICNASFVVLDLSNNKYNGTIPQCLIESSTTTLWVLNLRNNSLTGNILGTFPKSCALEILDFNGNHLEGQVPPSLANCTNLEILNLGNNNIKDNFPCFLKSSSNLSALNLRSNKFQGEIQCEWDHNNSWPKLQIIDLASNNFSGPLPKKGFLYWRAMMVNGDNAQSYSNWLSGIGFKNNLVEIIADTMIVTIKGQQLELVKILTSFTHIDFSNNSFQGGIPDTVGALKYLHGLNLSHNALTGHIPSSLENLTQLESLDLSWNKLSGSIPVQLASLTFLSLLNVSYNQLVGMIPKGSQIQTFPETSFEGNKGLCGLPLNTGCVELTGSINDGHSYFDQSSINWVKISATLGFSVGFGVVVGPLVYCKRWRRCYYKYVDRVIFMILGLHDLREKPARIAQW